MGGGGVERPDGPRLRPAVTEAAVRTTRPAPTSHEPAPLRRAGVGSEGVGAGADGASFAYEGTGAGVPTSKTTAVMLSGPPPALAASMSRSEQASGVAIVRRISAIAASSITPWSPSLHKRNRSPRDIRWMYV